MDNNLYKVEKSLRSIAKRYKSIKYSLGLAILFLMMGVGAFSEEVNPAANGVPTREEIATSKENLKNSVGSLQSKIDSARAENEKGLTGLKLELIQLMEQGDQVVKSPWASWQFGLNYMYSDWRGTYKGRGDKSKKYPYEGVFVRESEENEINRYVSSESSFYSKLPKSTNPYSASSNARQGLTGYGIASTIPVPEPIVDLELNAAINPKVVNKADLNLAPKTANKPTLPEPVRFSPIAPNIVSPDDPALPVPPTFKVYLGADCNSYSGLGCNSHASTPRQRTAGTFLASGLNNRSKQNINTILHYTWPQNPFPNGSLAFKMWADDTRIPRSGDDIALPADKVYFNSYNYSYKGGVNEYPTSVVASKGVNKNDQYFFIGGSRFIELDNMSDNVPVGNNGVYNIPSGKTVNLGGIFTLGLVSQENGTDMRNSGTITDEDEKDEYWIQHMPTDPGKNYLTIKGPTEDYQITKSGKGYVGYKVGIAQVEENSPTDGYNVEGQKMTNTLTGQINFYGTRSIGMYVYLPTHTTYAIMENKGKINLFGKESYGMKLAAKSDSRAAMINSGTITLGANGTGLDRADNSAAMAVMEDKSVIHKVNLDLGKAVNKGTINLTDVQNSSGAYINIDSDITNDTNGKINISSTIAKMAHNQAVNVGMRADAGTGNGGTNKATVINKGTISLDGSFAMGMLANGAKLTNTGTITTTANKTISNGIGVVGVNNANIENTGIIKLTGTGDTNNIGVYLKGSTGTVGTTGTPSIDVSGNSSIGVFTVSNSTLTMRGDVKVSGNGITGIVAKGGSQVTLNGVSNVTVNNNGSVSSPIGARGSYGVVVEGSSSKFVGNDTIVNAKITNPESIGLYSEGNLTVNKANITATNGALNFYANNGKIEIRNGGTTETGQKSLLFYAKGANANIRLSGGTLNATIKGGSTPSTRGTAFYYEGTGNTFNKTAIENYFKTVFGDGAGNSTLGHLNLNMEAGSRLFVASKVKMDLTNTAASKLTTGLTGGPNISGSGYKTFMLYLSELTVDNTVNLDNATDPYNQLEIANSSIENKNTISGTKNRQVAMAQENGKDTSSTPFPASKVKLINDTSGKINLTGEETTGMYVKRGQIDNKGEISVGKKSTAIYLEDDDLGTSATEGVISNSGKITLGENSTGIYFKNRVSSKAGGVTNSGKIGSSANNVIAMTFDTGSNTKVFKNDTAGEINLTGDNSTAMYATGAGTYTAENAGKITLGNSANVNNPNIAMFTDKSQIILKNNGKITAGNKAVGLYGYTADTGSSSDINVGQGGTGIYSKGGNVTLNGKMTVGANDAVGVYSVGFGQTITNNATNINIGDSSYGFVNKQTAGGNTFISNTPSVTVGNDVVYAYSTDTKGSVNNKTALTSTGSGNYGLYSAGNVTNDANINFGSGTGNVGVYSISNGTATNRAGRSITVGGSDPDNNKYGIGMAAGYEKTDHGNIINQGTINVNGKNSIGMYATGRNSTATNNGTINLGADEAVGMYLDNGAKGVNNGTITTVGSPKKVTGVAVRNGATFENNGTIHIDSAGGQAYFKVQGGIIKNYGTFTLGSGAVKEYTPGSKPTGKEVGGVNINAPAGATRATITRNGNPVTPVTISNVVGQRNPLTSSIGMYVDTLRGTNPIGGLIPSGEADLIIGSEASKVTTAKDIEVNGEILKPYNKAIAANPQITNWKIYSGAFTWIATGTIDSATQQIKNLYLSKIPYTKFAGNESTPVDKKDTYNFLDGLEQRYGVEKLGSRENQVFQKLNGIGNNEEVLFYQATDEMMGHQYANVQQRIQSTGKVLDKEFDYLRNEWQTVSKDSNKVKVFGTRGEYKTDTAGVIDYKNYAYGVAYVHEDEDIKMGRGVGWYTGIVQNTFKFKDIGKSKEEQLQGKVGLLKSVPFDHNNSLNWTITGDIFVGYNKMHRKYLVVDDIFNAKARYYTYGIGVKNQLTKSFRLSEDFSLSPYVALNLEYGRVSKIREKSGEIKLQVKHNDYFSVSPEIGAELAFRHFINRKTLRVGLGVAYENELGRVANGKNKAKVAHTNADWFNIRGEKEDRRGNVKFDLNLGLDNQRYGVTANAGYDTKGHNIRGGLGLRVIF
ncbi:autotransporter-associated N-terminal domain-containing protein [Fusobacterium nucleatum]|uniref:autotransporter-associated N-terminal domain-containing protein n=1 Tax=Fusobacterium nucleatum TaxID=851 RepID=UPI00236152A6|nr:autotransporter-associated N-terminal domain-containing protein [Fusobacterium nucleatum]WDD88341.1 autotransporter-associated N-terminal domain-containing protein [Fusobacterium nucleatum]